MVFRHRVTAFGKGVTIPCTLCLVAKHHDNAVSAIIQWAEYQPALVCFWAVFLLTVKDPFPVYPVLGANNFTIT